MTIVQVAKTCSVCGGRSVIEMAKPEYDRWRSGELIQNVLPGMKPEDREVLITGTHPQCWKDLFGEEGENW